MRRNDNEYFTRRAAQELAAADLAADTAIAAIHRELAERYLARAGPTRAFDVKSPGPPVLHSV